MSPTTAFTLLIAFAALMAAGMLSRDVEARTNCLRLEDARAWLFKHHGEREVWEDPAGAEERMVIFRNSETGSATILQLFDDGTACLLDDGGDA